MSAADYSQDDGEETGPDHPAAEHQFRQGDPVGICETKTKRSEKGAFLPGFSGNPAGRPKGSRNKLADSFLDDVLAAWESQGRAAIQRMIDERPQDFVKMVMSLLPRNLNVSFNPIEQMTDEQLFERIRKLDAAILPFLDALDAPRARGAEGGSRAPATHQQAQILPALCQAEGVPQSGREV